MSDNLRHYRAISDYLKQIFAHATGRQAQQLVVLAALTGGIVAAHHSHLPRIAEQWVTSSQTQQESRVKRLSRWLTNSHIHPPAYFAPFARALLEGLAERELVLVMDGSQVGRDCMTFGGVYAPPGRRPIYVGYRRTDGRAKRAVASYQNVYQTTRKGFALSFAPGLSLFSARRPQHDGRDHSL